MTIYNIKHLLSRFHARLNDLNFISYSSPLKKMVGGMLLAAIAFAVTGFVQIRIQV